ncbi:hypothetical protein FACS189426_16170 [Bacteroidia bacterium]|nr:hypothetical protein FACS189426_16170 [Bacteroidia bacterium]
MCRNKNAQRPQADCVFVEAEPPTGGEAYTLCYAKWGRTPYIILIDDMYEYLNKLVLYLLMGVP